MLGVSISNRIMKKNSSEWQLIVWGLWSFTELINLVRAVQLNVTGCFEWDDMSTEKYVQWSGVKKCWFYEGGNCQSLSGDGSKKKNPLKVSITTGISSNTRNIITTISHFKAVACHLHHNEMWNVKEWCSHRLPKQSPCLPLVK